MRFNLHREVGDFVTQRVQHCALFFIALQHVGAVATKSLAVFGLGGQC